jgi:dihydrofolate synthase / folylpolyglutamate synthase
MTYKQTLDFLFSQLPAYHQIGKAAYKNNLDNTIALDNNSGNPHHKFLTIHVAGTNGKGSVSHMIASVLQEAGYKTGLYTSPHLKDFRERIKINGKMISRREVIRFVENNKEIIGSLKPSFFEMSVSMAFTFFAEKNVDIAVIEVGLGGRLDSTNIINPILSVITNIGHDHMDLLGDTLEKIAIEKAGIIKPEVPVVISETQHETRNVFISAAVENSSLINFADQNFSCNFDENISKTGKRKYLIKDNETGKYFQGETILAGDYQAKNLMAVFQAFKTLGGRLQISDNDIISGIDKVIVNTGLSGRWQILKHDPLTVCDTGHNKEGLEYIMNQIKKIPKTKLHMIIGFVADKDLSSILPLFPKDAVYYFTKASVVRALNQEILKTKAAEYGLYGKTYANVRSAMRAAAKNASVSDMIFIGGSTFIVGDAL